MGERLNASIKYNLDAFTNNEDEHYTEESGENSGKQIVLVIVIVIVVILLIGLLIAAITEDDYDSHGGFGGDRYHSEN